MNGEIFYLSRPSILIAFIIFFICFAIGCVSLPLSPYIPSPFDKILAFMAFVGLMFSIIYGIFTLVLYGQLQDFIGINRIVISGDGFLLYKKDGTIAKTIPWQDIKNVEYQESITHFLGEYREPQSVKLNLIEGNTFEIPIGDILKVSDRFRMVATIQYNIELLQEQSKISE